MKQASYLTAGCYALSLGVMSQVFAFNASQDVTNYEQFGGNFNIDGEISHRINPRSLAIESGENRVASIQRFNQIDDAKHTELEWDSIRYLGYKNVAYGADGSAVTHNTIVPPGHLTLEVVRSDGHFHTQQQIELYWYDDSNNESQLIIERCQIVLSGSKSICLFEPLANVAADVTTFSDRPGKGLYKYRIKAINANASSDYSNVVGT